ncbi:hypothetical protein BCR36DRAFT_412366 [Piromyces finnis]|uniref:Uncharacterized protein n=1 Tax=Piromyces finnis TaxID=1754191 RepID=A0A1Y1VBA0_9FUNG|nr:hypothetical protein BCR36DRAFT_412366 [Piromyces finnis]|eukprot:ORX50344.1 hypothetical protein BCR36DRAFT_412366 [Piromyces finnis]
MNQSNNDEESNIDQVNTNDKEETTKNKENNSGNEKENVNNNIEGDNDEEINMIAEEYKSLEYTEEFDELTTLELIRPNEFECLKNEFKLDDKHWYGRVSKIFQLIEIKKQDESKKKEINSSNDKSNGKRRNSKLKNQFINSDTEEDLNGIDGYGSNNDNDNEYGSESRIFDDIERKTLISDMIDMFCNIMLENYKNNCFLHKFLINYIQYSIELSYAILEIFKYVSNPRKFNLGPIPRSIQGKLNIFKEYTIDISDKRVLKYNSKLNLEILQDFLEKYRYGNEKPDDLLFDIYNIFSSKIITYRLIYFNSPFLKSVKPFDKEENVQIDNFSSKHFRSINLFSNQYPGCERDIPSQNITHFIHDNANDMFICLLYDEYDEKRFLLELNTWYKKHPFIFHNQKINITQNELLNNMEQLLPLIATVFQMKIEYKKKIYTPIFNNFIDNKRYIYIVDDPIYKPYLYYIFYSKSKRK